MPDAGQQALHGLAPSKTNHIQAMKTHSAIPPVLFSPAALIPLKKTSFPCESGGEKSILQQ